MTRSIPKTDWHPASWQALPAAQQPSYPNAASLERAVADLSRLPPIVTTWEIEGAGTIIGGKGDDHLMGGPGVLARLGGLDELAAWFRKTTRFSPRMDAETVKRNAAGWQQAVKRVL